MSKSAGREGEALLVVGIGGTVRPGSSTDAALQAALDAAKARGAATRCFAGPLLAELPLF